jgi:hypothetical protein
MYKQHQKKQYTYAHICSERGLEENTIDSGYSQGGLRKKGIQGEIAISLK